MMKALLMVLLVGAASAVPGKHEQWEEFKQKYGKAYKDPAEEHHRMKVFADNKALVDKHMKEYAAGKHSFTMALNRFADLTSDEFIRDFTGLRFTGQEALPLAKHQASGKPLAAELDCRSSGLVTSVKDQGQCGSCWAFSAIGALEGAWARAGRGLQDLSTQQLVDCSTSEYDNDGCSGGWMHTAFDYISDAGGISSWSDYPYTATEGSCRADVQHAANITGYVRTAEGSEDALLDAVASVGPVSVGIDASLTTFQLYSGGVFRDKKCGSTLQQLNHAVVVVGYGRQNGKDYWLVKNSWGTGWGEDGYGRMARNADNQCGIATYASYPVV